MATHLTSTDVAQLRQHGLSEADVQEQLARFAKGMAYCKLDRPATVNDGIVRLSATEMEALAGQYDEASKQLKPIKFVPASGAATRMFKDLLAYRETGTDTAFTSTFFERLPDFAFYPALQASGINLANKRAVLDYVLDDSGLGYANKPKALLAFHKAEGAAVTAFEEHLAEAAQYAKGGDGVARLHFTVSPQHRPALETLLAKVQPLYEQRYAVRYQIAFSEQHSYTDTVAATADNALYRDDSGNILFRPAGHGALLENLDALQSGLVFIKNIDNVLPASQLAATVQYKKALAGLLLQLRSKAASLMERLEKQGDTGLRVLAQEANQALGLPSSGLEKAADLMRLLNRPIRVCGMVPNTGEPGGGPFWVRSTSGTLSLQIVEKAQIDMADAEQADILGKATHFNPVDLVCSTVSPTGQPLDLRQFRDDEMGFITQKSHNGTPIRALELPGLWNGAMADWITVFAEVPLSTFNPVKTVNDLLKAAHQA